MSDKNGTVTQGEKVDELQEYATEAQIEYFDRLRSGDDPEHQCAAGQLQGIVRTRGVRWCDVHGSACSARSQGGTTAHNARTFDNNTMAAKEAATKWSV